MYRRHDDYRYSTIPPAEWIRDMSRRIQLDNWRRWRRAHQRAVLRALVIALSLVIGFGALITIMLWPWHTSFGLSMSGRLTVPNYHTRAE